MTDLQQERERLEKKLTMMEANHAKQFSGFVKESAYQESCNAILDIYQQLSEVAEQLGDPVPVRF